MEIRLIATKPSNCRGISFDQDNEAKLIFIVDGGQKEETKKYLDLPGQDTFEIIIRYPVAAKGEK